MKKSQLQELQDEILESKGVFKIYVFFLILSLTIIFSFDEPILAYFPQLTLEVIGLVSLIVVYFGCKKQRNKKQTTAIVQYLFALLLITASTLSKMFR